MKERNQDKKNQSFYAKERGIKALASSREHFRSEATKMEKIKVL